MPAASVQLIAKFALSARCQGYTLSAAGEAATTTAAQQQLQKHPELRKNQLKCHPSGAAAEKRRPSCCMLSIRLRNVCFPLVRHARVSPSLTLLASATAHARLGVALLGHAHLSTEIINKMLCIIHEKPLPALVANGHWTLGISFIGRIKQYKQVRWLIGCGSKEKLVCDDLLIITSTLLFMLWNTLYGFLNITQSSRDLFDPVYLAI